jgi:peptidoglycan/LPS O-acetylase OafA/YrhL
VLYHYTARGEITSFPLLAPLTQFGYLGVPLFFMISGFVISASAENRTPSEFVISRITRLFPAYWFGVAFTLIAIYLLEGKSCVFLPIVNTYFCEA